MRTDPRAHTARVVAAATAAAEAATLASAAAVAALKAMQGIPDEAESNGVECTPFADVDPVLAHADACRRGPSVIQFGRVHFACPACRRFTVLPVTKCGDLISCPNCYTGIRVPDPRKHAPAENLGRTTEPLLRPERFSNCADARKFIPWLIGRLPSAGQLVAASGMILFFAVTSATAKVTLGWARNYQTVRLAPVPRPAPIPSSRILARQAELVVRQFLDASTIEEKAALVVNARKTKRLMNEWYRRRPGGSSQTNALIGELSQGFYATPGDSTAVSEVPVDVPGSRTMTYIVEHRPEGPLIAWAESVGYSSYPWQEVIKQSNPKEPVRLRLLACLDDYYNYGYKNDAEYSCVRFHDPSTMEQLGFGYIRKTEGIAEALAAILPAVEEGILRPVTVAVRSNMHSAQTKQVEIVGAVTPGWRMQAIPEQVPLPFGPGRELPSDVLNILMGKEVKPLERKPEKPATYF